MPRARHFVREHLRHHDADLQDAAEACISELVTNAVLHARTELEVAVRELDDAVRLEVLDRSPVVPHRLVHTLQSATGRGMEIVSLLSRSWGVDQADGGAKTVWCSLDVAAAGEAEPVDVDRLLDAWSPDEDPLVDRGGDRPDPVLTRSAGTPGAGAAGAQPAGRVVLRGYPVRLGIRLRDHTSALLRECALLSQTGGGGGAPDGLVRLARAITDAYSGELAAVEQQRTEAFRSGTDVVDLAYPAPTGARHFVLAWRETVAMLDAYAEANTLLTLATPPDLVQLRDWTLAQFVAQMDGEAPTPWTGPLD